jgi:tetraacyldisaccharide 4'-kinase
MTAADKLVARWYDERRRPWLARPLTWLYRGVVAIRAWLYRRHWLASEPLPVPVIVVGNITVGGTGKTPLVIALADYLRGQGWQPGVVSRGYAGTNLVPALLPDSPDPARFGDEPCLIHGRAGVPIAVGRDRVAAAKLLIDAGCDLVMADDGLQHYRLRRDIEIGVSDGERRLGNGLMLPCGPLREPPSRLRRVDFRVVNGGTAGDDEVPMTLVGERAQHLLQPERECDLASFAGTRVHAIAGIGNPPRFFGSLRAHGIEVIAHAFADHHVFTRADLEFADALPVLMTEKDAVKCAHIAHADCWSVPVRALLPDAFFDRVGGRVCAVISQ